MAKKIRFPLEMENGIEVRSMEELRNNFSLGRVLEYVQNEKLVIWLRDRYENNIADAIAELDKMDSELPRKVSAIFDIPYDEKIEEDLKQAAERAERIKRLKEFTDEKQYADKIDNVAFDQDELYDLLDEEVNEVYLCGDRFEIPLSVKGISYKGINNPVVVIDSKTEVDWLAKEILLEAVRYDDKYQAVVERESAKKMYILAKDAIENLNYDADAKKVNDSYNTSQDNNKNTQSQSNKKKTIDDLLLEDLNDLHNFMESFMERMKYETMIENINSNIKSNDKRGSNIFDIIKEIEKKYSSIGNTALALIYDYEKCNEYAKVIMDNSTLLFPWSAIGYDDSWKRDYPTYDEFKDPKRRIEASKELVQLCRDSENTGEGYKFIFWALMILTVEKTDAEEHLALICDFAKMLRITEDEFEDIIQCIKIVYNEVTTEYVFKSETVRSTFGSLCDLYGISYE